jgi:uncharacterized protein
MKELKFSIVLKVVCLFAAPLAAEDKTDTLTYTRQESMIPMRDGIRLFTVIYTPKGINEALPILLFRTPYGVQMRPSPNKTEYVADMAGEGYIFVYQDIRGRYKSEGIFAMQDFLKINKSSTEADASTDVYDAVKWLLNNVHNNNGKVGLYGVSADGTTALAGTIYPHPAIRAASVQAPGNIDWFMGDDWFHNGAFRLNSSFEFSYLVDYSKEKSYFTFNSYDVYEWYLNLGPLSNVNLRYFHDSIPTWNNFVNHPTLDEFWKKQSLIYFLKTPEVPILFVAGWWDQEDFSGPLKAYEVLEKNDRNNQNFIVIGPWNHGGWTHGSGEELGNIHFGNPASEKFRKDIQAQFFAYNLKGKSSGKFPEARIFQTGSNTWKDYEKWPPVSLTIFKNLYINSGNKLSFDLPSGDGDFAEYLSDPFHPVPYQHRPIVSLWGDGSRWSTWLLEDQRFVHNRPDVASWETDALTEDLEVTGNLLADIFASTTGTDADWVVKLIDVYPEYYPEDPKMGGYQLMVANDVLRGRFRNGFTVPEPVKPNEICNYKIDLHAINHVFKKSHKIMVQIQSTWFPVIDRNPQKYVPNIFEAKEADFIVAYQRIYGSVKYPSHIELPVIKK